MLKNMQIFLFLFRRSRFVDVLRNRCSEEFRIIHKKTPALESFSNRVAGLKACSFIKRAYGCFPVNIVKFLGTLLVAASVCLVRNTKK